MSEWLGCEAIVRQREKEQHAAALAKCASGASVDPGLHQDSTISTDVSAGARVAWTWFAYRFTNCMFFSLQSSHSSSSEKPSHVGLHSDSNSSTQVKTQPVSLLSSYACLLLYFASPKHKWVSSYQTVWIQSCTNNVVQPRSCDLWICLVRYLTFNLVASKKLKYFVLIII